MFWLNNYYGEYRSRGIEPMCRPWKLHCELKKLAQVIFNSFTGSSPVAHP